MEGTERKKRDKIRKEINQTGTAGIDMYRQTEKIGHKRHRTDINR